MGHLNVTERDDGINRAGFRVGFAISRATIVRCVLWHLEHRYGRLARDRLLEGRIDNLSRTAVLRIVREALEARGMDVCEAGGRVARGTLARVGVKVATLFPEFD